MLRKTISMLILMLAAPLVATATPATISVEPWRQVDGNFGFLAVHAATGGLMEMDGIERDRWRRYWA